MNMRRSEPFTFDALLADFCACGVQKGQTLILHGSLSRIGFVIGGAETVVRALLDAVGEEGTLVVPTQTWKNLDPERGVHGTVPEAWYPTLRDHWPAYDPAVTPSLNMGALAETVRLWPGAARSAHPARSFAALGAKAKAVTAEHPLESPTGEGSPLAALYNLGAYVLLLGVGHDKNTSLHLAEDRADYASKSIITESSAVFVNGQRQWVSYEVLEPISDDFETIGAAFEEEISLVPCYVGNAETKLLDQRALVDFAAEYMNTNRGQSVERLQL